MKNSMPVRYRITDEAVANRMGDQIVVVHVGTDRIFELNRTAAYIWELLSKGHDRVEIHRLLTQEFEIEEETAAAQIDDLLNSLLNEKIIAVV